MTTKRTPLNRPARRRITPQLRPRVERLLELYSDHLNAIRGNDETFYDSRHEELVELIPEVCLPLGIKPWENAEAILRDLLAGLDGD